MMILDSNSFRFWNKPHFWTAEPAVQAPSMIRRAQPGWRWRPGLLLPRFFNSIVCS